jgi:inner membrane protein
MASPVGHSLVGVSLYLFLTRKTEGPAIRADWKTAALLVTAANLPDIDFLIGFAVYGDPNRIHGGWTHAGLFAAAAALVLTRLHRFQPSVGTAGWAYFFVVASHAVLDFFTGPAIGLHPSYGVDFLWPFYNEKLKSPVSFFQGPRHRTLEQLLTTGNLWGMVYELLLLVPVMWGLILFLRKDRRIET